MQKDPYHVVHPFSLDDHIHYKDATVELTRKQARYLLLAGKIKKIISKEKGKSPKVKSVKTTRGVKANA